MYYRGTSLSPLPQPVLTPSLGANAALLLYDITNASTFQDVRGWLQGLSLPQVYSIAAHCFSRVEEELLSRPHHIYCRGQGRSSLSPPSYL